MTQEGFKRKLTSIFSAGAVGCSRLMGDDEAATVRTLTSYRNVIYTLTRQHKCSVFLFVLTVKSLIFQTEISINLVLSQIYERG